MPTPTVMPVSGPMDGVVTFAGVTVVNVLEAFATLSAAFFAVAVTVYLVPYARWSFGVHTSASGLSGASPTVPGTAVPAASTTVTSPRVPPVTSISSGTAGETSAEPFAGATVTFAAGAAAAAEDLTEAAPPPSPLHAVRKTSAPAAITTAVRRTCAGPPRPVVPARWPPSSVNVSPVSTNAAHRWWIVTGEWPAAPRSG